MVVSQEEARAVITESVDRVAILRLNRPDKMNALSDELSRELLAALDAVDADDSIKAIILTGNGRAFCAGGDVSKMASILEGEAQREPAYDDRPFDVSTTYTYKLRKLSKPVIAAVNGPATGAGFAMSLACDFRICSTNARFSAAWVHRGLDPGGGSSYTLPRIVGVTNALYLFYTGKFVSAEEALEMGLATKVVPHEELMDAALAMAAEFSDKPRLALAFARREVYQGLDLTYEMAQEMEVSNRRITYRSADHREGVMAFLEKREPRFS